MEKTIANQRSSSKIPKHVIWDCGSSLYDSFELQSFERQLDAAICSRTLSMPHLSERRLSPPTKKSSRSLLRLIRSVFKPRNKNDFVENHSREKSGSLSSIPEGPEYGGLSSADIRSLGRRPASERFTDFGYIGVY